MKFNAYKPNSRSRAKVFDGKCSYEGKTSVSFIYFSIVTRFSLNVFSVTYITRSTNESLGNCTATTAIGPFFQLPPLLINIHKDEAQPAYQLAAAGRTSSTGRLAQSDTSKREEPSFRGKRVNAASCPGCTDGRRYTHPRIFFVLNR